MTNKKRETWDIRARDTRDEEALMHGIAEKVRESVDYGYMYYVEVKSLWKNCSVHKVTLLHMFWRWWYRKKYTLYDTKKGILCKLDTESSSPELANDYDKSNLILSRMGISKEMLAYVKEKQQRQVDKIDLGEKNVSDTN